jgi:multicomponent Na+:H+ antiporter subunit D
MTLTQWMPFVVLMPLILSGVSALLPGKNPPWLLALVTATASAVLALLVWSGLGPEPMGYAFGNWAPPMGIEYRVDHANAFVAFIVSGIAALALLWGKASTDQEIPKRQGIFYALFLLALAGLLGITLTGDAFNVFVFLEISSLSTYALIAFGPDRRGLLAAFRYLIMGTIGATFILIGIGFLYMMTGTLNMADLAERIPAVADTNAIRAGFAFIIVGLGLKLALLPLHLWLPNAYAFAPNVITVFLAGTATKVALYVMLRFIYTIFGGDYSFGAVPLASLMMVLAVAGMVVGSWVAMFEPNLKRMMAYSSVAQVGYLVLGVALVSMIGLTATFVHLFNHALIKAGLFMALGTVMYRTGSARIEAFYGIGRQMPWTMSAFALLGLSLIGVPATAGFISKWYLIWGALDAGLVWLVVLILITSFMAVYYIWRVIEAAWFTPPKDNQQPVKEAPLALLIPLWLMVALNVYFGLDTRFSLGAAERAAQALLGGF